MHAVGVPLTRRLRVKSPCLQRDVVVLKVEATDERHLSCFLCFLYHNQWPALTN